MRAGPQLPQYPPEPPFPLRPQHHPTRQACHLGSPSWAMGWVSDPLGTVQTHVPAPELRRPGAGASLAGPTTPKVVAIEEKADRLQNPRHRLSLPAREAPGAEGVEGRLL